MKSQEGLEDITLDVIPYLGVAKAATVAKGLFSVAKLKTAGQRFLADRSNVKINHAANKMPTDPSKIGHIFRNKEGHILKPSKEAEQLLLEVCRNVRNYLGKDRIGNSWYGTKESDGSQIWVSVWEGTIQNGGINAKPLPFNFLTGLKAIAKKGGGK